jgi:hypothetical protein
MFLVIRTHGAGILTALGKQEDSLRSIARQFGLTHTLLARSLPVISKFEADIARADFEGIEKYLFEPVGRDYKLMPFYKKLTGKPAVGKPSKRRAGEGVVSPERHFSAARFPTPPPEVLPIAPNPDGSELDVFAEFVKAQPTLARAKFEATTKPAAGIDHK